MASAEERESENVKTAPGELELEGWPKGMPLREDAAR
jgi:hypothetical protein